MPLLKGRKRVVIFAGQRYCEFLVPALLRDGYEVDVPMAHLLIENIGRIAVTPS